MRALLLSAGVLGLAAFFGLFEPTPVSARPVTSDDVRVLSEQISEQQAPNQASSQRCAHRFRCFGGGGHG